MSDQNRSIAVSDVELANVSGGQQAGPPHEGPGYWTGGDLIDNPAAWERAYRHDPRLKFYMRDAAEWFGWRPQSGWRKGERKFPD